MGKNTRNFRQSSKSLSGNRGAQTFNQVQRAAWHQRVWEYLKVRGKGENNV
jgi:hypothetical protein